MEQVTGIEPALKAWEALILPLNYTCTWTATRRQHREHEKIYSRPPKILQDIFSACAYFFTAAGKTQTKRRKNTNETPKKHKQAAGKTKPATHRPLPQITPPCYPYPQLFASRRTSPHTTLPLSPMRNTPPLVARSWHTALYAGAARTARGAATKFWIDRNRCPSVSSWN